MNRRSGSSPNGAYVVGGGVVLAVKGLVQLFRMGAFYSTSLVNI